MMIAKGEHYKKKIKDQREEKKSHETDGCVFRPQINLRKTGLEEREKPSQVFSALYDKRKNKDGRPKKDRTTLDVEYDQQKDQCTFKPKITSYQIQKKEIPEKEKPNVSQIN